MEIKVVNIIMLTNLHLHVKTWRKKDSDQFNNLEKICSQ